MYSLGYLVAGLLALCNAMIGQVPDSCVDEEYSFLLEAPLAIQEWQEDWLDDSGKTVALPHFQNWDEVAVYYREFDLPCDPEDTLFIVIEGLAWNAELELNGAFIATFSQPLHYWVVPLPASSLKVSGNRLTLRAYRGEWIDFSPSQFVGFLGGAWLMDRAQTMLYQMDLRAGLLEEGETAAALVPWVRQGGFSFNPHAVATALVSAKKKGISNIFIPIYPHRDLAVFCRDAGFNIVKDIDPKSPVVWLNYFPYESASFQYQPAFWLDEAGHRTQAFGLTQGPKKAKLPWSLIVLSLVPLVLIATMRMLSPVAYKAMWMSWRSPARGMDSWFDNTVSNRSLNALFTLFRLVQGASLFTLWLWVLRAEGLTHWLNLFKDWSILSRLFYTVESPLALFLRVLVLYGGIVLLLFVINSFLGRVFKRSEFPLIVTASENLASFPMWWLLAFSLLAAAVFWGDFHYLALGLLLFFVVWRVFILFFNAERRLGITSGVKYLYICASIFPYLLLF
jgi:hypothetical protein